MELVITFRESDITRFTYTVSESRLKLGKNVSNPIDTSLISFAEDVVTYLEANETKISLRGRIKKLNDFYELNLADSNATKHLYYSFFGDGCKEIKVAKYPKKYLATYKLS